jgi:hypothetical protein
MLQRWNIAQYTLSRFLTASYDWAAFGRKRVSRLQQDEHTRLKDGDVVNLDDTVIDHPYGKKLPFLCWLFDSSQKIHVWGMNIVVLQAVLRNGLEYPLSYMVWRKPENKGEGPTKLDLAQQMLLQLRTSVTSRLWVAMDRWYLCKDFFVFLTNHQFDWVTKAKRNTALFRKEIEPITNRVRYVPVRPLTLIKEVFGQLRNQSSTGLVSIPIPNIYIKLPFIESSKRGKKVVRKELFEAVRTPCDMAPSGR